MKKKKQENYKIIENCIIFKFNNNFNVVMSVYVTLLYVGTYT